MRVVNPLELRACVHTTEHADHQPRAGARSGNEVVGRVTDHRRFVDRADPGAQHRGEHGIRVRRCARDIGPGNDEVDEPSPVQHVEHRVDGAARVLRHETNLDPRAPEAAERLLGAGDRNHATLRERRSHRRVERMAGVLRPVRIVEQRAKQCEHRDPTRVAHVRDAIVEARTLGPEIEQRERLDERGCLGLVVAHRRAGRVEHGEASAR